MKQIGDAIVVTFEGIGGREFKLRKIVPVAIMQMLLRVTEQIGIDKLEAIKGDVQRGLTLVNALLSSEKDVNTFMRGGLIGDHEGVNWYFDADFYEDVMPIATDIMKNAMQQYMNRQREIEREQQRPVAEA